MPDGSATAHLYRPKLWTSLRQGYTRTAFRQDALAGLTVAIVAFPLSMAIAVASGVAPEHGLYAAIIGGLLVSALGGSRYQIGGPAGAFIVLVSSTVSRFGLEGLLLTVLLSGGILALAGAARMGSLIRRVPHAVAVGFTAAIAILILGSQLKDLGGLTLAQAEPSALVQKLQALWAALPSFNLFAFAMGTGCAAVILLQRRLLPGWPGMLMGIVLLTTIARLLSLPVETIADRFGSLPTTLPSPRLPVFSLESVRAVGPSALSFALLGGIESLLSARIGDGMTGRRHRANMELVAQGFANVASALFGGIAVTGTIARTATNIRAGAQTPMAGVMHAAFVLLILAAAAPWAAEIPLAVLAGVLLVVCWDMLDKEEFRQLLCHRRSALILLTTFLLTLLANLTVGILAGWALSWATGLAASLKARRPA